MWSGVGFISHAWVLCGFLSFVGANPYENRGIVNHYRKRLHMSLEDACMVRLNSIKETLKSSV